MNNNQKMKRVWKKERYEYGNRQEAMSIEFKRVYCILQGGKTEYQNACYKERYDVLFERPFEKESPMIET